MFTMASIVAKTTGFAELASAHAPGARLRAFSLAEPQCIANGRASPMLLINGDADPYIPLAIPPVSAAGDVRLIRNGKHCAANHFTRQVPAMAAWLRCRLYGNSLTHQALLASGKALLPARQPWHRAVAHFGDMSTIILANFCHSS